MLLAPTPRPSTLPAPAAKWRLYRAPRTSTLPIALENVSSEDVLRALLDLLSDE